MSLNDILYLTCGSNYSAIYYHSTIDFFGDFSSMKRLFPIYAIVYAKNACPEKIILFMELMMT